MKMSEKLAAILLLVLALPTAEATTQNKNNPETTHLLKRLPDAVIELAIQYDTEFAGKFDNDAKKIQNYWEVILYDVHLRFQTLPSFRTSFRVTSLIPFVGHGEMIEWDFDIFVMSRATLPSGPKAKLWKVLFGSICTANDFPSTSTISLKAHPPSSPSPSLAENLAIEIAHLLGAPEDPDDALLSSCDSYLNKTELCCIMGNQQLPLPKYFSNFTDYHLAQKLAQLISEQRFCLDETTAEANPIIDSAQLFKNPEKVHGYTIAEQCQMLQSDTQADFVAKSPESDKCLHAICVDNRTNKRVLEFTPLELTSCGNKNKGRCLRGLCIQQKFQLVNVGTGKCLVSQKGIFGTNDYAILQDCSNFVTQMFAVPGIVQCCSQEELVLSIPYAVNYGIAAKKISLNLDAEKIVFCSGEGSNTCRDTVVQIHRLSDGNGDEFVLEVGQGLYMKASEDGINAGVTNDGTGNDNTSRWKLVELVKGALGPEYNCDRECKPEMIYSGKSENSRDEL